MGWKIHQIDVKTAFLNGIIKEEVYIEKPKGLETFDREYQVYRLKRELYGLKQAPYAWYITIDSYLTGLGFTKSGADENLYHILVEEVSHGQAKTHGDFASDQLEEGGCHFRLGGNSVRLEEYIRCNFHVGIAVVSWYCRKQGSMTLSSIEEEYMAASQASREAIWMRKILVGLFGQVRDPNLIYRDNQRCIKLYENHVFHGRSKHIDIQYHHLRDCV
eukprot:PITA_13276